MALLDPDNGGAILWQRTLSERETSTTGNLGPAFDGERAYVSLVYPSQGQFAAEDGAVVAFRPETGEVVWTTEIPAPESCASPGAVCSSGSQGALTAIPGAVFVGALDGTIRALSSETGQVLWAYNTNRDFETANGVLAHGGELGGAAPTVAGVWSTSAPATSGRAPRRATSCWPSECVNHGSARLGGTSMSERVVVSTLGVISVCASAFFVWAAPGAASQAPTVDPGLTPIVAGGVRIVIPNRVSTGRRRWPCSSR